MEDYLLTFFAGTLSVIGGLLVYQFKRLDSRFEKIHESVGDQFKKINDNMEKIEGSVSNLNNKIAVVISDQAWHMKEIESLKEKIERDL